MLTIDSLEHLLLDIPFPDGTLIRTTRNKLLVHCMETNDTRERYYVAKEISIIGGEGGENVKPSRNGSSPDSRYPTPRGRSFPFLVRFVSRAPEDNEHNYGEVFVLEITQ